MKVGGGLGAIRPIASLSSGLLARKGQARPAMRPQGFAGFGGQPPASDDLGWNDMGGPDAPLPPVLVERSALEEEVARIAAPGADVAVPPSDPPATPPARPGRAAVDPVVVDAAAADTVTARGGKAAFTLRLASDRHLRLRLAAAVTHRSAQALVTQALDAFLSTLPEVEELAARCATPDRLGNPS